MEEHEKEREGSPRPDVSQEEREAFALAFSNVLPPEMSLVNKAEATTKVGMMARMEWLGNLRDGLLVLGGLLYIIGYAIWSFNAWKNGLGLLPALEAQYFIAGIGPALIIGLVSYANMWVWRHAGKISLPGWLASLARYIRPVVLAFMLAVPILSWTGVLNKYFGQRAYLITMAYIIALFLYGLAPRLFRNPGEERQQTSSFKRFFKRFFTLAPISLQIIIIGLLAFFFFTGKLYTSLPQALGGVRPRCAYLDLANKDLSKETVDAILPTPSPSPTPNPSPTPSPSPTPVAAESAPQANAQKPAVEITRSIQVEVLFSGSDYVLIRAKGKVYEIKKDMIHAIMWCDRH